MKDTLRSDFEKFKQSLLLPPLTSIRINPLKRSPGVTGKNVPWCSTGKYLEERPVFTLDPHLHAGAYYVQEASSMFVEQAVRGAVDLSKPLRVLDLCAAPGGKSTHLLSLLNDESLLVSNEVIRTRASILSENVMKWGKANVVVTNNDPKDFHELNGFFDLVVVDAPCSGEGLFRKDEDAMNEWSEDNVNLCSLRQRRILGDVWPAIRENGILIYCTCTFNAAENEDNLLWLSQQKDVEFISVPANFPGIQSVENGKVKGYRFMPHLVEGEGFFISVVRKLSKEETLPRRRNNSFKISKNNPGWLNEGFDLLELNELLIAVPSVLHEDITLLSSKLNVVTRGVAVATITRNKLVPEHALGLSVHLKESSFPAIDLDKNDALKFLAKETINPTDNERGFAIIRYEGNALGFVNRLGNRFNNLYPAAWRIRMSTGAR